MQASNVNNSLPLWYGTWFVVTSASLSIWSQGGCEIPTATVRGMDTIRDSLGCCSGFAWKKSRETDNLVISKVCRAQKHDFITQGGVDPGFYSLFSALRVIWTFRQSKSYGFNTLSLVVSSRILWTPWAGEANWLFHVQLTADVAALSAVCLS